MAIIHDECGGTIQGNVCTKCGKSGKLEEFGQGEEIHAKILSPTEVTAVAEDVKFNEVTLKDIKEESS